MLPVNLVQLPAQNHNPESSHSGLWTTGTIPTCSPRFEELFSQVQYPRGLPSPPPTVPAASPPNWSTYDASYVAPTWPSPRSQTGGEAASGELGLGPRFQTHLPPAESTFFEWPGSGNAQFHSFHDTYPTASAVTSLPQTAPPNVESAWRGHPPITTLANGELSETTEYGHVTISSDPPTVLGPAAPPAQAERGINLLQCPPAYPPNKRPPSGYQQEHQPSGRSGQPRKAPEHPVASATEANAKPSTRETGQELKVKKPPAAAGGRSSGPTLRTAARRVKRPASAPRPGESDAHRRARTNHNQVEQNYRHRLHARFVALLDSLPEGILDGDGDDDTVYRGRGTGGSGGCDNDRKTRVVAASVGSSGSGSDSGGINGRNNRRMSKVDVLTKADRVIKFLEYDIQRIKCEMEGMERQKAAAFGERLRLGLGSRAEGATSGLWPVGDVRKAGILF